MKCFKCESDARAVCRFCGRAVCSEHLEEREFYTGYGMHEADALSPYAAETGVHVRNAVWCGKCSVSFRKTY